jgi:circadian clock protein KaiA
LAQAVSRALSHDRYVVTDFTSKEELFKYVDREKQHLDCLILQDNSDLPLIAKWLHGQATLLPVIILRKEPSPGNPTSPQSSPAPSHPDSTSTFVYHTAEVSITPADLDGLNHQIERAIAQFINLSPTCRAGSATSAAEVAKDLTTQNFLLLQQRRLTEKLKERLGYLGVYYKRNPQNFIRHLPSDQKQELLDKLRSDYRDIVLCYFVDDGTLNQRIDDFVNTAFFTDISVSQIVELHMELMDEFAKQLKLEGRSEEILLDYRLTLIDTIAHLCEMYRRSIPRES